MSRVQALLSALTGPCMPSEPSSEFTAGSPPRSEAVLVTGATGFAGGCLARRLRRQGCRVRALVRPSANVQPLLEHGVEVIGGDITRATDVERAAEGVCKIFHVAAAYRTAGHPDDDYFEVKTARWYFENGHLNGLRRQAVS